DYSDIHSFPTRRSSDLGDVGEAALGRDDLEPVEADADDGDRCAFVETGGGVIIFAGAAADLHAVGIDHAGGLEFRILDIGNGDGDRKSTRLNSSHVASS